MQIIIITFQKNTSGYPIARQLTEQQQETVTAMIVVGSRPREILSTGLTNDAVQFNKFNVIFSNTIKMFCPHLDRLL
ncbi:8605_t:CDS:2 [Rhizophagus irregularis]|nr:8605_t:CDS:2 [Rhizophagus irregularis]